MSRLKVFLKCRQHHFVGSCRVLFLGTFLFVGLLGCTAGNPALRTAQRQAELSGMESQQLKLQGTDTAKLFLDSSYKAVEIRDEQLALVQAELSNLEYRVVFAKAENEQAKKDSALVSNELKDDKKRLEAYKKELENERSKGAK